MTGELFFTPAPDAVQRSQMTQFQQDCSAKTGHSWTTAQDFHRFSIQNNHTFWAMFLAWSGLQYAGSPEPVRQGDSCEHAVFFPNLTLNYTANLLYPTQPVDEDATAIISCNEQGQRTVLTWRELRKIVTQTAQGFRTLGLQPGDHVVAIARNTTDTAIAALATVGLGAVWSSISPDLGADAMLTRLTQLAPRFLFAHDHYEYQGHRQSLHDKLHTLFQQLPSLQTLITLDGNTHAFSGLFTNTTSLAALQKDTDWQTFSWPMFSFNHPLFVLFSSGTTGVPKCIVHGAGGTLLEHLKEHRLHSELGPQDRLLFYTSCGWMMWNWQLSALASGVTLVLYDGSPTHPEPDHIWNLVRNEHVTVFGTSPTYLQYCRETALSPRSAGEFQHLRAIQSTGSVLYESLFDWIREHVGSLPVQSISGGTDIIGCFVLGHPNLPVYRGESQCISLGMDVRAWNSQAQRECQEGETGELICTNPFPSRPLYFLHDPENTKFHQAYFAAHENVWTHGDFIILHARGSARILGRSDGILNIRGIRIGPAEIYHVLQDFPEIAQSMVLEQQDPRTPGGTRMVLLVVMAPEHGLTRPLTLAIKKQIKQKISAIHVPAVIAQVSSLPATFSGKLSTRAASDALHGLTPANLQALRNPACLDDIRNHPALVIP